MTPKIHACYIVYNNGDYIRASLESVIRYVDHIIIVDGRFATYPGESWCSTDETLPTIHLMMRKFPGKITLIPAREWRTQVEKRNAYMDLVPAGDWVLVIDGDEILCARDWNAVRKELDAHYELGRALIKITNYSDRYRFFVKKSGMKYEGYHWKVLDPETGENVNDLVHAANHIYGKPMQSLVFAHMKHQRDPHVVEDKKLFYETRKPIEDPEIIKDMIALSKNEEFMKKLGIDINE